MTNPQAASHPESHDRGERMSVTDEIDGEIDFTPAADSWPSAIEPAKAARSTKTGRRKSTSRWRRRLSAAIVLAATLTGVGFGYAILASSSGASDTSSSAEDIAAGKQMYLTSCITCHGANLEGIADRGPSLIGVGSAAAYFQVSTGRMPATAQGAQIPRKDPKFTEAQTNQIAAYIQSVGGGPEIPSGDLRADADLATGGELFRLNCASCHNFAGKGAPLSAGKYAPDLNKATDEQMYAAMLTGPQNMPVFSDNQLTPQEKRSIVDYVQTLKASNDPGGAALGRSGPVPEGLVIWIIGVGALIGIIMWIGAKS
jgi:ubiquinol-cytochrome c reductase cytochrome c subunit